MSLSQVAHEDGHFFASLPSNQYPSIAAEHFPAPFSVHTLQPVSQLALQVLEAASGNFPGGHVFGAHKFD